VPELSPHRPKDLSELELGFARQRAVRWLSPRVLVGTGLRVLLANIFGSYSDKRELQAVLPSTVHRHDDGAELWFDFVADVGDGFDRDVFGGLATGRARARRRRNAFAAWANC